MPESVHLCDFPAPESVRDLALERQMELAMNVVSLGRFLRKQHNLKVRQPLARVVAVGRTLVACENTSAALPSARMISLAEDLERCAGLWRTGDLQAP